MFTAGAAHRLSRARVGLVVIGLAVALTGCGGDSEEPPVTTTPSTSTASTEPPTTETATTGTVSPTPSAEPSSSTLVRAYFLRDEKVGPVARHASGNEVAAGAIAGLLAGPDDDEMEIGFTTAIPSGTELLGVEIEDRVATVDLSEEFGSGGGSASMTGRVAQLVFTVTQFPTVDAVSFKLEGEPVTALGGEGLVLDEPQTRADWEAASPAILVESPLPFGEASSPLRIEGTANTFEAVFGITVTDGDGLIVYDESAMATSGTGTRGTFDVTARFDVPTAGLGAVIVYEESAQDGSRINIVELPVHLE